MLTWLIQGLLSLLGIKDWLEKREARQQGEQEQRDVDLEAQNAVLKKQLEIANEDEDVDAFIQHAKEHQL